MKSDNVKHCEREKKILTNLDRRCVWKLRKERSFFLFSNRFAKLARFLVFYEEKMLQHLV